MKIRKPSLPSMPALPEAPSKPKAPELPKRKTRSSSYAAPKGAEGLFAAQFQKGIEGRLKRAGVDGDTVAQLKERFGSLDRAGLDREGRLVDGLLGGKHPKEAIGVYSALAGLDQQAGNAGALKEHAVALAHAFQAMAEDTSPLIRLMMDSKNQAIGATMKMMNAMFATQTKVVQAGTSGVVDPNQGSAGQRPHAKAIAAAANWIAKEAVKPGAAKVAEAAQWIAQEALKPASDKAVEAARWAGENAVKPASEKALEAARWAGENAVKPASEKALEAARWAGENAVKPGAEAVAEAAQWIAQEAVKPAAAKVAEAAKWLAADAAFKSNRALDLAMSAGQTQAASALGQAVVDAAADTARAGAAVLNTSVAAGAVVANAAASATAVVLTSALGAAQKAVGDAAPVVAGVVDAASSQLRPAVEVACAAGATAAALGDGATKRLLKLLSQAGRGPSPSVRADPVAEHAVVFAELAKRAAAVLDPKQAPAAMKELEAVAARIRGQAREDVLKMLAF